MHKYIVIHETGEPIDQFGGAFDTLGEANHEAFTEWAHLTDRERKNRHVFVALVDKKDLEEYAIDEDGNIEWGAYTSYSIPNGAFDGDKYERERRKEREEYEREREVESL